MFTETKAQESGGPESSGGGGAASEAGASAGGRKPLAGLLAPLATCLLITLATLHLPRSVVTTELDPSWSWVLDFAHQKGLQFGTEIVFTHGPLGFLATQYFSGLRGGAEADF